MELVPLAENVPPTTPHHERVKREKMANQILEHLVCSMCLEVVQFPLLFPCRVHVSCHVCIHKMVNLNKYSSLDEGEIEPFCIYPITCPVCRINGHTNENLGKDLTRPLGGSMTAVINAVSLLQKNSADCTRVRVPLTDDLNCPYCKTQFRPDSAVNDRYEHLTVCTSRIWTCQCDEQVMIHKMDTHLRTLCKTFKCKECGQQNLSWQDMKDHRSRTSDTSLFCSQVSQALTSAGRWPIISHREEWKHLPKLIRKSCDLLNRHRNNREYLDKVMNIYTETLKQFDDLDSEWNAQTLAKRRSFARLDTSVPSLQSRDRAQSVGVVLSARDLSSHSRSIPMDDLVLSAN